MCGLLGGYGQTLIHRDQQMLKDLLTFSCVRGYDGAGVASIPAGKRQTKTAVVKTDWTGADLAMSEELEAHWKQNPKIVLGHTRWLTTGEYDTKHNHPIQIGHITGMHNGTFYRVMGTVIDTKKEHDSTVFYEALSKHGIDKVMVDTTGQYALVWIDENEKTLNFLRASNKTLFIMTHKKDEKAPVFWASESSMMVAAMLRNGFNQEDWDINPLPEDTLVSYPLRIKNRRKMTTRPMKLSYGTIPSYSQSSVPFEHESRSTYRFNRATGSVERTGTGTNIVPFRKNTDPSYLSQFWPDDDQDWASMPQKDTATATIVTQSVMIHGGTAYHVYIPEDDLSKTLMNGCVWCGEQHTLSSKDRCTFVDREMFFCDTCVTDPIITKNYPSLAKRN